MDRERVVRLLMNACMHVGVGVTLVSIGDSPK